MMRNPNCARRGPDWAGLSRENYQVKEKSAHTGCTTFGLIVKKTWTTYCGNSGRWKRSPLDMPSWTQMNSVKNYTRPEVWQKWNAMKNVAELQRLGRVRKFSEYSMSKEEYNTGRVKLTESKDGYGSERVKEKVDKLCPASAMVKVTERKTCPDSSVLKRPEESTCLDCSKVKGSMCPHCAKMKEIGMLTCQDSAKVKEKPCPDSSKVEVDKEKPCPDGSKVEVDREEPSPELWPKMPKDRKGWKRCPDIKPKEYDHLEEKENDRRILSVDEFAEELLESYKEFPPIHVKVDKCGNLDEHWLRRKIREDLCRSTNVLGELQTNVVNLDIVEELLKSRPKCENRESELDIYENLDLEQRTLDIVQESNIENPNCEEKMADSKLVQSHVEICRMDEEPNEAIGTPRIEISEVSVIAKSDGKDSKEPMVSAEALDKKELCHDDPAHLNVVEVDLNRPKEATSGIINVLLKLMNRPAKRKLYLLKLCFGSSSNFTYYKKMDQRTCIKFCVKNEIKCADAFRMLTVEYGEATLDRSNVYRLYKMFSEGREDVNDEERAGRPSTSTTDEKINEVEKMILPNRRITVREVAEDLNITIGSCHSIFINDLGMRRVAAKFVPKLLNCDQKQHRMNIANEMLDSVRDDPNLLQRVITGDEAWVYGYDVETKAQSSQWKLPHEPRPKKACQVRSNVKVLLTVFFDCRGVVHHEFLPQGRTVNEEYYLQVMRNLREAIRQKRPDL
ncbi:hypothetical protein LAZ67_5001460 [Cordylochernes scorpioides]|uniref:Transposase n=1 Tax=Cordylochernes scorpioides TaxID=51811 RepID=A0ABY6KFM6_9ARAC|nr:hypothetical protein LAZ67_5001460 [Cordylochernes scorpioides]